MTEHRIVCFGDSNTYGYDPRSYLGSRYPKSVRWTGRLEEEGWTVINEGENGRCIPKTKQEAAVLAQTVLQNEPAIAVVMLGSNDLLQQPTPSAEICAERMERFLSVLLETIPASCKLLLVSPPPMKPGAWVNDSRTLGESKRLAGCYSELANQLGLFFADAGNWGVGLTFDGVHFTEKGHAAFAGGIQKVLEQIMPYPNIPADLS